MAGLGDPNGIPLTPLAGVHSNSGVNDQREVWRKFLRCFGYLHCFGCHASRLIIYNLILTQIPQGLSEVNCVTPGAKADLRKTV